MPRNNPNPQVAEETRRRIRRRYKKNLKTRRKFVAAPDKQFAKDQVVLLKLANYSHTQIGKIVGISRGQVREFLKEPDVAERLEQLQRAIPAAALELLHAYMLEAVQAVADVMRSSESDDMILKAAGDILDRGGVPKSSRGERKVITEDKITIGTEEGLLEALRQLPPDKQEEAAQMIENVENFLHQQAEKEPEPDE